MINRNRPEDFKGSAHSNPQVRNLRELDFAQIQQPKTLIVLHYNDRRMSVPLFQQVFNLGQLLYLHISKLEQTVLNNDPSWQKKSNSQIVCFQIKKDSKNNKQTEGDLRTDVLLSLLRIQSQNQQDCVDELSLKIDVTKLYKYLQLEPFYRFFNEGHSLLLQNNQPQRYFPYYNFHCLLASSSISNTYLTRRVSNGYFYSIRVYANGSQSGLDQIRNIAHIQQIQRNHRGVDVKCSLLCISHEIAYVPNPETQEYEQQDDESNCKHIALVYPYFLKGSLQQWLKQGKNLKRKINEMDCLNYLQELMWGAHILHQKYNLIHRAIVPANLQIDQNNRLRLVNYCSCLPCFDAEGSPISYIGKNDRKYGSCILGDLQQIFQQGEFDLGQYTAIEVVKGQPYNYLVDFYSIGMIIKKLYMQSQVEENVPVSQNNQNHMMTMINKLTSADLEERAAVVADIIENIEKRNMNGEEGVQLIGNISLQQMKVGRPIELSQPRKFIENEQRGNGIQHETVIQFFRQPNIKRSSKSRTGKRKVTKNTSKDKSQGKNSREKSQKQSRKKSSESVHDNAEGKSRKNSKNKNNSFKFKEQSKGQINPRQTKMHKQSEKNASKQKKSFVRLDSPAHKRSSKSSDKSANQQIRVAKKTINSPNDLALKHRSPVGVAIPKYPKGLGAVRSRSPDVRQKHK